MASKTSLEVYRIRSWEEVIIRELVVRRWEGVAVNKRGDCFFHVRTPFDINNRITVNACLLDTVSDDVGSIKGV
ncbi:MAG: hypothetical protein IJH65_05235 [Methanobrevibacter sp.]|nr:hypothetical protein [Methanobrevibacter sp.]